MTVARMHKQRPVKRKAWEGAFLRQKPIPRGTTAESGTAPVLTSISPTTGEVGTAYTVTCTGSGYVSGQTVITLNNVDVPTHFVSATSLTTSYTPKSAGAWNFLVRNNDTFSTTPRVFTATEPE
jgi:hypothetical protein